MPVTRQKKESILKELNEQFEKARLVIFVNFHGLNTAATTKLRRLVKTGNGLYQVAKKTLIKKTFEKFNLSGIMPDLSGEIGIIFGSGDITELAKNLAKFIKEHKELTVSGGILESGFIGPKMVAEIAALPTKEILLAKLVYTLNSPLRRLVGGLEGNLQKLVIIISQIKK